MPSWTHPIIIRTVLYCVVARPDVLKLSHSSIIPGLIVVRMTDCYATKDRTLPLGESRPESGLKINSVCVNRLQCCLNLHVFLRKETLPAVVMYLLRNIFSPTTETTSYSTILCCVCIWWYYGLYIRVSLGMVSPGAVPLAKWIIPKVLFKGCCLVLFTPALGNRNRDPKQLCHG